MNHHLYLRFGAEFKTSPSVSPLFQDVVACLGTPLLEIKKSVYGAYSPQFQILMSYLVVYLFLVSYGRSKPDQIQMVIPSFLQVSNLFSLRSNCTYGHPGLRRSQPPLIRALAIRTMSYIPLPIVTESLTEPLRHALKDRDPYVRKTAAICVAKVYMADPRRTERAGLRRDATRSDAGCKRNCRLQCSSRFGRNQ